MQLDKIEGSPDSNVAWGSDVAAQMLRRMGISYVSLNPGASYRGLHDSIVNHLGNERPGILLCLHEDHSVAIAHGYAKATGEPMACVLHSNVGLLQHRLDKLPDWPDVARFAAPEPSRPPKSAITQAVGLLERAERPVIMFG